MRSSENSLVGWCSCAQPRAVQLARRRFKVWLLCHDRPPSKRGRCAKACKTDEIQTIVRAALQRGQFSAAVQRGTGRGLLPHPLLLWAGSAAQASPPPAPFSTNSGSCGRTAMRGKTLCFRALLQSFFSFGLLITCSLSAAYRRSMKPATNMRSMWARCSYAAEGVQSSQIVNAWTISLTQCGLQRSGGFPGSRR